jgi:hypothetical protein
MCNRAFAYFDMARFPLAAQDLEQLLAIDPTDHLSVLLLHLVRAKSK